jgi:adenylate cyclase
VIVEDGDIHRDGFNIAARLGGDHRAWRDLHLGPRARPSPRTARLRLRRHRRSELEEHYRVGLNRSLSDLLLQGLPSGIMREGRVEAAGATLPLPDKPSIAVLPFQNLSGDPEQEYFADGMVEEIITALSRIRCYSSSLAIRASPTRVSRSM